MKHDEDQTYNNTVYNIIGYILPVLVYLVSIPVLIGLLGVADFGLITLVSVVSGLLSILNFGLGSAATKNIPVLLAKRKYVDISKTINLNIVFFLFVGLAVLVPVFVLLLIFPDIFAGLLALPVETSNMVIAVILGIFFINLQNIGMQAVFVGFQEFKFSNLFISLNTFLTYSLMILLAYLHQTVYVLIWSNLVVSAFTFILSIIILRFKFEKWSLRGCLFDWKMFKHNFMFGVYLFLSNLRNVLMSRIDKLIISSMFGTSYLTYYAIPNQVSDRIQGFSAKIGSVLFPMVAKFDMSKNKERLFAVFYKSNKIIMYVGSIISVILMLFSSVILTIWISADFARNSAFVLIVVAFAYFIYCVDIVSYNYLNGRGLSKQNLYLDLVTMFVFMAALIPLTIYFGILGAAVSTLIGLSTRMISPIYACRIYGISFKDYYIKTMSKTISYTGLIFLASILINILELGILVRFFMLACYACLMYFHGNLSCSEINSILKRFLARFRLRRGVRRD